MAGGWENRAGARFAVVSGGQQNTVLGQSSTIAGGCGRTLDGDCRFKP